MPAEFDYQWKNLPSKDIEFNDDRVKEFLAFTKINTQRTISQKYCLDAGCGSGRYTYAMLKLGAMRVDSFDISSEAVEKCKQVNPDAKVYDLMQLDASITSPYDFVLSWGVLNHISDPKDGFMRLASIVSPKGGCLHIMVYHADTQKKYEADRQIWPSLSELERLHLCEEKVRTIGGTVHGWWDALNPTYNWGFSIDEIKDWYKEAGFRDVRVVTKYNININGIKGATRKS